MNFTQNKKLSEQLLHLKNAHDLEITLFNYNATLTSVKIFNEKEIPEIVLGFNTLQEYIQHPFYFGCTIGHIVSRITQAKFSLGDQSLQLECNENQLNYLPGDYSTWMC